MIGSYYVITLVTNRQMLQEKKSLDSPNVWLIFNSISDNNENKIIKHRGITSVSFNKLKAMFLLHVTVNKIDKAQIQQHFCKTPSDIMLPYMHKFNNM